MKALRWWQTAVFYQVYPRSFADSNGDGIGDLPGIIEKLDYLQDLGITAVWLSPHYPSPLFDTGYDIADYHSVAPEYGDMQDFQRLLQGAHQRGIRLILDLVLNHTSHLHPWFLESRLSRDNPKRDWYIWRNPVGDGPPNNWCSTFGGSAWEWDETTGQYYYHYFFKEQPDLNWRNPQVKQAMFDIARYWLDKGVDGFRLDAIGTIYEDPDLTFHDSTFSLPELVQRSQTATSAQTMTTTFKELRKMFQYQRDLPEIHDLMKEFRKVIDEYDDRVLVGETEEISFYGSGEDELHLVFNFPLMRTPRLTPDWVRANQGDRLATLPPGAWPCNTLGNHDSPRVYSRYCQDDDCPELARIALALMLTLRGTPFLYNGEEIGMTDTYLDSIGQFKDMLGIWMYNMEIEYMGATPEEALAYANHYGRDKCRTPMQWANASNAGFSPEGVETWLPVNANYAFGVNVVEQENDESSLLNFYRRLLRLRKNTPALIAGDYVPLQPRSQDYLVFIRRIPDEAQVLVAINFTNQPLTLSLPELISVEKDSAPQAKLLYSSQAERIDRESAADIALAPYEICVAELKNEMW